MSDGVRSDGQVHEGQQASEMKGPDERSGDRASRSWGERLVALAFTVAVLAGLALTVVYSVGGQPQLEGLFLAVALGGIGVGAVVWAQRFMPSEEVTEDRIELGSTDEEVEAFTHSFETGEESLERRSLLVKLGLGALGALGLAAVFPIRSLGPRPGRGLKDTGYAEGVRLVTVHGRPVRPDSLVPGTVLTVWPEGHEGDADSPTLLIRTGAGRLQLAQPTVDDIVAYSKLCTHTGCPVGLYQQQEQLLLCPCHQSTFDVLDGAEPIFGPAARPLPQLPIGVDDQGFFVALGEFPQPVGGGFWDRKR
ncbi:MAG: Rieske 2Fe-2S domain-containing protein [Actinobacteria bacterium]|nr:Rieske 2Fe-2S domain-containing protein [Actinomycetota bacterium]